MTESDNLPQQGFDIKLSPLSVKFLKFIKTTSDQGKHTYINDIKKHFNYKNHQIVSKQLGKLENNQLIESHSKEGKRVIDITTRGVEFLYSLGCSYLSELEQMLIKNMRDKEKIRITISHSTILNQDDLIKDAIVREFGGDVMSDIRLEKVCQKIRQIFLESINNKSVLL